MWLAEDVEAALEWAEWKASLCPGCGNPKHESFAADGPNYEAEAWRCRACEARDKKASIWARDEHADTSGIYFVIRTEE
jgi:hypothetical protein